MKWKFTVLIAVALLSLVFVVTVAAGGPPIYDRWVLAGTSSFKDPDRGSDVSRTFTETTKVQVVFASTGWFNVYDEGVGGVQPEYLEGGSLLKEEPQMLKDAREQAAQVAAQAALDVTKVGDLTWKQLRELLSGMGFVPAAPAVQPAAPVTVANTTYVVQQGDSLGAIAKKYGVTLQALLDANGLTDKSVIHPGDRLVIPSSSSGTVAAPAAGSADVVSTSSWPKTVAEIASFVGLPADWQKVYPDLQIAFLTGDCPGTFSVNWPDGKYYQPFLVKNNTGCHQQGQIADGSTGVPAGYSGGALGLTFRPCPCYGK